ncbi:hypothetical protein RFW85_14030, partial [Acinetobacter sp. 12966]|uniref:hypothetical protein n=1 Tax=Acinetobacter sp. 12966 TaxID=3058488 RepID=UPI0028148A5F
MEFSKFNSIENLAKSVLCCLENELKNFVFSCHKHFPRDCCDIASGLLFRVLSNEGYTGFNLMALRNKW